MKGSGLYKVDSSVINIVMKIVDLYETRLFWDLAGGWITDGGEWLPVDHDVDRHHSHVALKYFEDVIKDTDEYYQEHGEFDKYSEIYAEQLAQEAGWIRVSTKTLALIFDITVYKMDVTAASYRTLLSLIKQYARNKYSFGMETPDPNAYNSGLTANRMIQAFNKQITIR